MKKTTKIILPAVILIISFALMIVLIMNREKPAKRTTQARTKMVKTEIVALHDIPAEIIAYGRITSTQTLDLYSEVTGILMPGNIPFLPGKSFSKGDLLLKIDDRQTILELNSKKSELMSALATVLPEIKVDFPDEYQIWQDYFNQCDFNHKLTSLPETENQKIKLYLSRFNVYKLYFAVKDLEITLEKHFIYAPFNGSIVSTQLRSGSNARIGSLLGQIINLDDLEVEIPISVQDVQWIDHDKKVHLESVELSAYWTGTIARLGSSLDQNTQTIQLYVKVTNNHVALPQGAFLKATIPGKPVKNAFTLPRSAIYNDSYVYLIKDGMFQIRDVSVARKEKSMVVINEGLNNGDTLVAEMLQGIAPGMPAQTIETIN